MKTLKENNSKATKDVLLHQIFQEISEENREINHDRYLDEIIPTPKKRKLFKLRKIQKKWQGFFIVILIISIFYVLFSTDTQTEIDNDIYSVPQTKQKIMQVNKTESLDILQEVEKKVDIMIEPNSIQITKESPIADNYIEEKYVEEKSIDTKPKTIIKPEKSKSEREKAKEALFRQMQN